MVGPLWQRAGLFTGKNAGVRHASRHTSTSGEGLIISVQFLKELASGIQLPAGLALKRDAPDQAGPRPYLEGSEMNVCFYA
jgi:hypothetical protein